MSRIKNNLYNLHNNFGFYNKRVKEYVQGLYEQSIIYYSKNYLRENSTGTYGLDLSTIEDSLGYVEDYLYYFYKNSPEDFQNIFLNLANKLKVVTVLKPKDRGIYGKFDSDSMCLFINPNLTSSENLSKEERTRLYVNHELGHINNDTWMKKVIDYLNSNNIKGYDKQLIYDGASLLDEAITQNFAENITYYFANKHRPSKILKTSELYGGISYQTNFDFYGEFQIPTILFSRTLRGIGNILDDDIALGEFCKRALKPNFFDNIVEEYIRDEQIGNLYYLLYNLGIIKNASYATFGYADKSYIYKSLEAIYDFSNRANVLRDRRPPYSYRKSN